MFAVLEYLVDFILDTSPSSHVLREAGLAGSCAMQGGDWVQNGLVNKCVRIWERGLQAILYIESSPCSRWVAKSGFARPPDLRLVDQRLTKTALVR